MYGLAVRAGAVLLAGLVSTAVIAAAAALYLAEGERRVCSSLRAERLRYLEPVRGCSDQTVWWAVALSVAVACAGLAAGTRIALGPTR